MYKSHISSCKYYQGKDIIENLFTYIKFMGKHFAIVIDKVVIGLISNKIEDGFLNTDGEYEFIICNNESTKFEANRIVNIIKNKNIDGIIGIGGGKVIDTSKLVSDICCIPLAVIPTSAASDAPCSAGSVIYNEDGTFLAAPRMKKNPDIVIVDTMIIANAPVRMLVAGMGDAFATYYEARACNQSGATNFTGGMHIEAAYVLAKLCNNILLEHGKRAKESVELKEWSESLEKVVEANIYLSGVGFENNGCAIAHAVYNGMTSVIKPFPAMHGEAVAFGTIVQLVTEYVEKNKWNDEEWKEVVNFYKSIGLPLSMRDLGIKNADDMLFKNIAAAVCKSGSNVYNMPFEVTPNKICKSLVVIDGLFNYKNERYNNEKYF